MSTWAEESDNIYVSSLRESFIGFDKRIVGVSAKATHETVASFAVDDFVAKPSVLLLSLRKKTACRSS